jgi:hypothetical protein
MVEAEDDDCDCDGGIVCIWAFGRSSRFKGDCGENGDESDELEVDDDVDELDNDEETDNGEQ